ncbi:MAG: trigger factor [Clostridia bacterium]|nr:trigger factor [Clostridia bacterium]
MSIKVKDLGKNQVEFSIAVDAAKFNEAIEKAYRKNVKSITLPGFRKGKAPKAMIERMYGEGIFFDDAVNSILPELYENAVKEAALDVVSQPEVDIPEISKEKGFTAVFKVYVRPVATVENYKGITAKKVVYTVKDEAVDAEIDRIRERNSRVVPVEDRAIENGDIANIDFEGFVDGVAFPGGKGDAFDLTIGSGQFIPGFEEQLIGSGTGDDVVVKVTFPEEYHADELKGKAAEFKVKINKVTRKELPEANDDLAQEASEFDTLAEFKADIKEKMQKQLDERANVQFENEVVDQIAKTVEIDIPEAMIQERVNMLARDFDNGLMQQGINREMYLKYTGMDEQTYLGQFKQNAEIQVKSMLVLEAIAKQEGIEATEADLDEEKEKLSSYYGIEKEKISNFVPDEDLKKDIIVRKAVDFVRDNAICQEISEEEAAAEASAKAEKKAAPKKTAAKKTTTKKAEDGEKEAAPKKTAAKKTTTTTKKTTTKKAADGEKEAAPKKTTTRKKKTEDAE